MAIAKRQYTIRNVPQAVDEVLRRRARALGKSFNQVALDALIAGSGSTGRQVFDDLDFMIGSSTPAEADALEAELASQDTIDPELWR